MFGLLTEIWKLTLQSSPYLLLGFMLAGFIKAFVKDEFVQKFIGKKSAKSVFLASLIGVPLPLCSCGVVPVAISLKKQGASSGAVMSFLVSTPETGVDSMAITYGLLGGLMTLIRPVAAFFTAIFVGFSENLFGSKMLTEEKKSCCAACCGTLETTKKTLFAKLKDGLVYAFTDLFADISKYLAFGLIFGGIITYFIPENLIQAFDGNLYGMIGMLVFSIPLYICATSSTPIASALILKGMSPGTALVFLLAGPSTNIASLTILQKVFGKKSILLYLLNIAIFSVLFGLLTDLIFAKLGIEPKTLASECTEILPDWLNFLSALIVVGMIFYFEIWKKITVKFSKATRTVTES
ncbi:SO_0444 family Cu/Zn efflux transporter [bacterium]|nr:SO_0444 family Cu/Zn efflux transporter [bacterium]